MQATMTGQSVQVTKWRVMAWNFVGTGILLVFCFFLIKNQLWPAFMTYWQSRGKTDEKDDWFQHAHHE